MPNAFREGLREVLTRQKRAVTADRTEKGCSPPHPHLPTMTRARLDTTTQCRTPTFGEPRDLHRADFIIASVNGAIIRLRGMLYYNLS